MLKHVQSVQRGDMVHHYLRIPGQARVKLPSLPMDHPDFLAAYAKACVAGPKPIRAATGTIGALVEIFMRSDRFAGLKPGYRAIIRRHTDAIRAQAGAAKLSDLAPKHIREDLAPLSPHAANQRRKTWRMICQFAVEAGLVKDDATDGVKRKKLPKTDGHAPWTLDDIDAYRDRWAYGTMQRLAFELILWTGARISDAVRIGPGMIGKDGVLVFRQQKTGEEAFVPWSCAIPTFAARPVEMFEAITACKSGHMTYLATSAGRARSDKSVGNFISAAARAAGILGKSAHGLRKSRATLLADGCATTHEIAAWTGHMSLSEVQHYTKSADRRNAVRGTEQDQNPVNESDPFTKRA